MTNIHLESKLYDECCSLTGIQRSGIVCGMVTTSDIGNVVRALRIGRNLSVQALALSADVDRGQLSKMENGRVVFTWPTLTRIAAALQVSVTEIVGIAETGDASVKELMKHITLLPWERREDLIRFISGVRSDTPTNPGPPQPNHRAEAERRQENRSVVSEQRSGDGRRKHCDRTFYVVPTSAPTSSGQPATVGVRTGDSPKKKEGKGQEPGDAS